MTPAGPRTVACLIVGCGVTLIGVLVALWWQR